MKPLLEGLALHRIIVFTYLKRKPCKVFTSRLFFAIKI
jgi:hypothetical protein